VGQVGNLPCCFGFLGDSLRSLAAFASLRLSQSEWSFETQRRGERKVPQRKARQVTNLPHFLFLCCCILLNLASLDWAATPATTGPLESAHFLLERAPEDRRLAASILRAAEAAHGRVSAHLPRPLERKVRLTWIEEANEFSRRIGRRGEVLAVAEGGTRRVILNGAQLRRSGAGRLPEVLAHEYVHVYVDQVLPAPIPVWLNEGLAMVLTERWSFDKAVSLAMHSVFGRLLTLEEITNAFPRDRSSVQVAYLQSQSMTRFLIDQRFSISGPKGLVADLASRDSLVQKLLRDRDWLEGFEKRWQEKVVRPTRFVFVLSSGTTLWGLLALVVIWAWAKRRRQRRQTEAKWAMEEEFSYHSDEFDD